MENNLTTQKSNPKGKAPVSLVLGIISLVFSVLALYFPMSGVSIIILFGAFFIAFLGLILGIIGLRSKKKLALLGIILCISTLVLILNSFGFLGKRWSFPIAPSAY
jgi:hypothetical protein